MQDTYKDKHKQPEHPGANGVWWTSFLTMWFSLCLIFWLAQSAKGFAAFILGLILFLCLRCATMLSMTWACMVDPPSCKIKVIRLLCNCVWQPVAALMVIFAFSFFLANVPTPENPQHSTTAPEGYLIAWGDEARDSFGFAEYVLGKVVAPNSIWTGGPYLCSINMAKLIVPENRCGQWLVLLVCWHVCEFICSWRGYFCFTQEISSLAGSTEARVIGAESTSMSARRGFEFARFELKLLEVLFFSACVHLASGVVSISLVVFLLGWIWY